MRERAREECATDRVTVRLPPTLTDALETAVEADRYASKSQAVRDALATELQAPTAEVGEPIPDGGVDEQFAPPETVEAAMYQRLEATTAWATLDEYHYQLSTVEIADLDVSEDVRAHLEEARAELAHARTLIEHEVAADVVDTLREGDDG